VSRQIQQYWWKGFRKQAARNSGIPDVSEALRELIHHPIIVSTHSLKYIEMTPVVYPPYRIFAVTAAGGYGLSRSIIKIGLYPQAEDCMEEIAADVRRLKSQGGTDSE